MDAKFHLQISVNNNGVIDAGKQNRFTRIAIAKEGSYLSFEIFG